MMEDLEKLSKKKKLQNKFDIVVSGFLQCHEVCQDSFKKLMKKDAVLFLEKAK